jgi:chromosome segregation ATPase
LFENKLTTLKEKCKQTDQEFAQRQKTRAEEIAAVGKALEFLSSDEAHDLFTRTFNFVQVSAKENRDKRNAASNMLRAAAAKLGKPQLAAIAESIKLDAFTKVKKAIDDMVAAITQQKADEIKQRDFCIAELNQNEADTTRNTRNKEDLIAKIDDLTAQIATLTSEINTLKEEVSDLQTQLKRESENREKENVEFQKTVEDQRATIALLTKTNEVLKGFYENSLLQQPAGPPPPAGFKTYENNAAGGGVIAMITQIIEDSKAMMAETTHDEEDAQAAYESFVKESNNSINAKNADITNKSEERATAEEDKSNAEQDLDDTNIEVEQLANEKADLHKSCDFYLKNFEVRQTAMDEEVEALRQAKAILSGMK